MFNECHIGQGFGYNFNNSYAELGLKGHTGIDSTCGWHSDIKSLYNGYVYKVLNNKNTFTGVFLIVDDGVELFEWLEGHCEPTVEVNKIVKKGDVIGKEANHGKVYSGNIEITIAMQLAGDKRGHHRHSQKRLLKKVKQTDSKKRYITNIDGSFYRDNGGNYFEIWDYYNGYNGCVDPSKPIFSRDLFFGLSGYDVYCLQRFLRAKGMFDVEPTGFFGAITQASVAKYQKQQNIKPTLGYFGAKTKSAVLKSYNKH